MVHKLIGWAVQNRLVVCLLAVALALVGFYSFMKLNVEAYPDPAPAIIEVIAQYPGASAEEVERQVTIPLEVALAGMPGLDYSRSKSLFGLAHLRNQFSYSTDFFRAKLEVLNRLQDVDLPPGVKPEIAPTSPTGEIYRYVLTNPKDKHGKEIYTVYDMKAINDWKLEKDFRRVQRIADLVSFGGAIKRYEIQPDPERLKQYGISLDQLENAITKSNANVGGDYLKQGYSVQAVRGLGLIGGGHDPSQHLKPGSDAAAANSQLRAEENRRLHEIRQIVLSATNNVPIKIADVVEGGPHAKEDPAERQGAVVGVQTRMGQVAMTAPVIEDKKEKLDAQGKRVWEDSDDVVQGIVLLRKGEQSLPALRDVEAKVEQLNNNPGELLPGVQLDTVYDRTNLINLTTATVRENVLMGIGLVTVILLVFLNHARSAFIVAINIPLALLFAFAVLYLRDKSANLLSLGAVDFGIIVDSSVIMVESIYRYVSSGERSDLDLKDRILKASGEVERSLFFSTIIMVFALLPLFTMQGPEGQIFGPMADTYAFALGGALILSLTLSPVLCRMLFTNLKPAKDNFLVRGLKSFYLRQLDLVLDYRKSAIGVFASMIVITMAALPFLGREFMPELEEGNVYIRGTFPVRISLDEVATQCREARHILSDYPEVEKILCQMGRPDDGTDPTGFYNAEFQVPLKHEEEWPKLVKRGGLTGWLLGPRARTKGELVNEMNHALDAAIVGVDWNFSQQIRDNVMETLSGVKGENSVKIFGPDLVELEKLANQVRNRMMQVPGIENVGVFSIMGQSNLEFAIDREKCALWNVSVQEVQEALQTAVGGQAFTKMVEGERTFDITVRWPERLRKNEDMILDIPVDVTKNRVTGSVPGGATDADLDLTGNRLPRPAFAGNSFNANYDNPSASVPRRRLRDLVVPVNDAGQPDPKGKFVRPGASTISREQGNRLIAIKFSVRGRDLASAVAEAQAKTKDLFHAPYKPEWSGEFQEMQEAVQRLTIVASLSLVLILIILYLALKSLRDAVTVLLNVVVMLIGGIWALLATGTNFNISAGVGFISVLGVGIMNGLLMVSRFNQYRSEGIPLRQAVHDGVEKLIRPVTMTALAAIFGLLPAAFSTRIGSQTQRPLAIVVVGGMIMTLLMTNLVPVIYSFYGHREPPAGSGVGH